MRSSGRCSILAAVALGLACPGAAAALDERPISQLFVQNARHGSLEKVAGKPLFRLRLEGVSPQLVWFTEEPARDVGQIPAGGFVAAWRGLGFSADHPNAALTLLQGRRRADTVVLELYRPRYEPSRHAMRY